MGLIVGFIVAVLGILAAALSRQLTDEFKAWTPWIIKHLVNRAIRKLSKEERDRFEEEWLAHVNELPGEVAKIIAALGFLSAARRISSPISAAKRMFDIVVSLIWIVFMLPLLLTISLLIKAHDGGPILIERKQTWNGRTVSAFKFRTEDIDGGPTFIGQILKRTNLSYLPTVINILRGDLTMPSWKETIRIIRGFLGV